MNPEGNMPAPEWSDEVAAVWGEDGEPITEETTAEWWYNALDLLFDWRIEQGMQPAHETPEFTFR